MTTTIKDFGKNSERYGDIAHYYAFPIRFWFAESQLAPDDVDTWLKENATGYYRTVTYTHKDSQRKKYSRTGEFDVKIIYVDKVYLSSEEDAAKLRMQFDVKEVQVKRPRIAAKRKKVKTYKAK